ncbi:CaiB/BaiF CoA transferase family protein, partial [Chloroflexota bacterium]
MTSIFYAAGCEALKGLKVLCLGTSGTILFTTHFLAAHGATAIWVESKSHPDIVRVASPFQGGKADMNKAANLGQLAWGLYSMGVNIRTPEGQEIVRKMAGWADVITYSFGPGVLEKLGLGYEDLRKASPSAVIVCGSALGTTGPYASFPAFGWAQMALSSVVEYSGWPDRPGVGPPVAYPDWVAPLVITPALLAALDYRRRTGKGQQVEFSQLECALPFVPSHLLLQYTANGELTSRMGNRSPEAAPHGCYPCQGNDRWCVISVGSDKQWEAFCRVLDNPEWTQEERFSSFLCRKENENELDRLVGEWTSQYPPKVVMQRLQDAGV